MDVSSKKNKIEEHLKQFMRWEYSLEESDGTEHEAFLTIRDTHAEVGWEYMFLEEESGGSEGMWVLVDLNLYTYPRQPQNHSWHLRIIDHIEDFDVYQSQFDNPDMEYFWSNITDGLDDAYDSAITQLFLAPEFVHLFLKVFHLHENFGGGTHEEDIILDKILQFLVHPRAQVCKCNLEVKCDENDMPLIIIYSLYRWGSSWSSFKMNYVEDYDKDYDLMKYSTPHNHSSLVTKFPIDYRY